MARLLILGSAAAVPDAQHDNTHFLLHGDHGSLVLVDCGSNPLMKLRQYGLQPDDLGDMILTHFHPDHIAGLSNYLMHLWLLRRTAPLAVYGLHHCIGRVEQMMDAFMWETWPGFFPVTFHRVAERDNRLVLDNADFRITSWPTKHYIPAIGLRIEVKTSGKVIAYSGDTEPIAGIVDLARGADILLHEAAGKKTGHTGARQAGEVAAEAGVRCLSLIHYEVWDVDPRPLVDEARAAFDGPVVLASDLDIYDI
jgi:ribonuclease Z